MKFENTRAMNFKGAFRGLRNPMNSWNRSDSWGGVTTYQDDINFQKVAYSWVLNENKIREKENKEPYEEGSNEFFKVWDRYMDWLASQSILEKTDQTIEAFYIGPNDLDLAQRMIRAGSSDRKFLRQIMVSVDITAPLYWYKQFDTYKIGTVANSTSTMHKLASTPITKECFEMDDYNNLSYERLNEDNTITHIDTKIDIFLNMLENLRLNYNQTKDKRYWKELVRWLPNGWLQTRTITMNYEILRNIYSQRKHHKLTEWHQFCDWVKSLPYGKELITLELD